MRSQPSRPLKIALVGCGQIADAHLQAVRRTGLATLAAVCDRTPDLARQAARRFGVPGCYADVERMLEATRPEVVHITTPPATHAALLEAAVDAGAHVYVEKPFAMDAAEADAMLRCATARGRLVCVGHDRLFDPAWVECRERIRTGAIGTVTHVEVFQAYDLDGPFGRLLANDERHWVRQLPGGLFQNTLPHAIATIGELLPDAQPIISAESWSRGRHAFDTELQVVVRGREATATLTFVTGTRPAACVVRVYGSDGWLEVDYDAGATWLRSASALPLAATKLQRPCAAMRDATATLARNLMRVVRAELHYFAGLQALLRAFYTAVRTDGRSPIDPAAIRRASRLVDGVIAALDRQALPGRWPSGGAFGTCGRLESS